MRNGDVKSLLAVVAVQQLSLASRVSCCHPFRNSPGGNLHSRFRALQFVLLPFLCNCAANVLPFKLKKANE